MPSKSKSRETRVDRSSYLDKEPFLCPEFAKLEDEKLWPYVWQVVCREEQVSDSGDWFKYDIGSQSVLVVRTPEGKLRAYYNSCLHRGAPLKAGPSGNSSELRCRYHGWRWNLDGSILEVTDAHRFEASCITCDKLQLPECRLDTWAGWVFISMDPNVEPLRDYLAPVPDSFAIFEIEKMRLVRHRTTVIPANWKTVMHAFTDGYHTQGTHPQLLRYYDDTEWEYEQHGIHGLFRVPEGKSGVSSPRLGAELSPREVLGALLEDMGSDGIDLMSDEEWAALQKLADQMPQDATVASFVAGMRREQFKSETAYLDQFPDGAFLSEGIPDWAIFPNLVTPMNPTNAFWQTFRPFGGDPELSLYDIWSLERGPDGSKPADKVENEFYGDYRDHDGWGRVVLQDIENVSHVQKGMHNRSFQKLICGEPDGNLANHIRVVKEYLSR